MQKSTGVIFEQLVVLAYMWDGQAAVTVIVPETGPTAGTWFVIPIAQFDQEFDSYP